MPYNITWGQSLSLDLFEVAAWATVLFLGLRESLLDDFSPSQK